MQPGRLDQGRQSPTHWSLQQIAQAKRDVVAQYSGELLCRDLEQLDRDTILGLSKFQNNHHLHGGEQLGDQQRHKGHVDTSTDLAPPLVDETVPIGTRLARICPQTGAIHGQGVGPRGSDAASFRSSTSMPWGLEQCVLRRLWRHLELRPQDIENASEAEVYEVVDEITAADLAS